MTAPPATFRWGRVLLGSVTAEVIPIALLVALVAALGPTTPAESQAFAAALGRWVGPLGGAAAVLGAAAWAARPVPTDAARHGVTVGVLAAFLDGAILVATEAPFEWLFVISNAGRVIAGYLGGRLAARQLTNGTDGSRCEPT